MKQRILTGLILLCIFSPAIIFCWSPVLTVAITLLCVVGTYEILHCIGVSKKYALSIPFYVIALLTPSVIRHFECISAWTNGVLEIYPTLLGVMFLLMIYLFAIVVFSHRDITIREIGVAYITIPYIIAGFSSIIVLCDKEPYGKYLYLVGVLVAIMSDIFAYFFGKFFGKHKLIPEISPKKTVEGSIAGVIGGTLSLVLYTFIVSLLEGGNMSVNYGLIVASGVLIAVGSQIGDLVMSAIKRTYEIKDFGNIFPGHGGVLDRFDSAISVSIILAIFNGMFNLFG